MNKRRIMQLIMSCGSISRQEIAAELGMSMPTVFQNVTELIDAGMVCESGKFHSTGGRKPNILAVQQGLFCSVGVELSGHHIRLALLDLNYNVLDTVQGRLLFENSPQYNMKVCSLINDFIQKNTDSFEKKPTVVGIGFAIPGILNSDKTALVKSHALNVSNISLHEFSSILNYDVIFENDANCAAYAELSTKKGSSIYLSLNDTVGGAIYINGEIFPGDCCKSGEFGHMVIVPNGKKCYCGKNGCLDAYCSAKVLREDESQTLQQFFTLLENHDSSAEERWNDYLDNLAVAVSNLRMIFDCDITIGGYTGGYMNGHIRALEEKLKKLNNFDIDSSYIRIGKYKAECAAVGAGKKMLDTFIDNI